MRKLAAILALVAFVDGIAHATGGTIPIQGTLSPNGTFPIVGNVKAFGATPGTLSLGFGGGASGSGAGTAGYGISISAGDGDSNTGAMMSSGWNGGDVIIAGGTGGSTAGMDPMSSPGNGGTLYLRGGAKGSGGMIGLDGSVVIGDTHTSSFSAFSSQNMLFQLSSNLSLQLDSATNAVIFTGGFGQTANFRAANADSLSINSNTSSILFDETSFNLVIHSDENSDASYGDLTLDPDNEIVTLKSFIDGGGSPVTAKLELNPGSISSSWSLDNNGTVYSITLGSSKIATAGAVLTNDHALDLASAPSEPVSAAGHVKIRSNAGALEKSENGGIWTAISGGGGGGSVTSVALTAPSFLSVAGSPITTSGTLAITLATESANTVFAGPTSGGAVAPTFRALVVGDLPSGSAGSYSYVTTNAAGQVTAGSLITLTGGTGINAIGDLSSNRTISVDQSFSPNWTGTHSWSTTLIAGSGDAGGSPTGTGLRGPNGSGTNIGGGNTTLTSGLGTGNATPSYIVLRAPIGGGSTGTTAQSAGDVSRFTYSGTTPLIVWGSGEGTTTPVAPLLRAPNGTGSNITGAGLTFQVGLGTGNASSGDIVFQYSPAGTSGTTQDTATNAVTINGGSGLLSALAGLTVTGTLTLPNASVTNAFLVNSSLTVTAGTGLTGGGSVSLGGSTSLAVAYGTSSTTATVGNDSRLPPTPTAAGKLPYDTGSAYAETAAGTSHQLLHGASGAPTWSAVDLASADVTGTLPIGNGGTGLTSATTGDIIYASGTNTWNNLADVAAGSYLRSGGTSTAPVWSTLTLPNAATTGDLLAATGSNAVGVIAAVAANQFFQSNGTSTLPRWVATPVFAAGLTASGSTPNDFSGGTGAFKTSTGAGTFGGSSNTFNGTNTSSGLVAIAPTAASSGTQGTLSLTAPASTGQTTATEINGVLFDLSATRTQASGTVTTQREFLVKAPTYAGSGGTATYTTSATFAIDRAPQAGSSAVLTNAYAFWVQAGQSEFDGNVKVAPPASTGAPPIGFNFVSANHTSLTAATEYNTYVIDPGTQEFLSGTVASESLILIKQPTLTGHSATATFTKASSLSIAGAPVTGTNANIPAAYAFWVKAGTSQFDAAMVISAGGLTVTGGLTSNSAESFNATGTFNTSLSISDGLNAGAQANDAIRITNSTASTSGTQQDSTNLNIRTTSWDTTAVASKIVGWTMRTRGTSSSAAYSNFVFGTLDGSGANPLDRLQFNIVVPGGGTASYTSSGVQIAAPTQTADTQVGYSVELKSGGGGTRAAAGRTDVTGGVGGTAINGTGDAGAGGAVYITGGIGGAGVSAQNPGAGGALTIAAGAAGASGSGNANGGSLTIDAGAKSGTGTVGTITIGGTNASAINIGNGSITTAFTGSVTISSKITSYNGETTDGVGVPYEEKKGIDVAWSGSSTTVADFTPGASGFYEVLITVSCTTSDTVTVQVTYTDAVNTTAQTVNAVNAVSVGTNGVTYATVPIRANTSTHIKAVISNAGQTTTKASAIVTRLN